MTNLAANLHTTAAAHPDNVAVKLDDYELTYAAFKDAAGRLATYLESEGVSPGDRIALSQPNLPTFPVIFYGALQAGAVVVPMNPLFKPREVEYYLADAGVSIMFGMADAAPGAEQAGVKFFETDPGSLMGLLAGYEPKADIVERADDDDAVILYTSGTTGRPKGAELTHANLNTNQEVVARTLIEITSDDVVCGCLPLFHVFGLTCSMNTAIANGATLTLIPRFDPTKVLKVIERDKATIFAGVPTMYNAMIMAGAALPDIDVSALRTCCSGGSSMPVEVMRKFEERFGATILEGYGLSETSPVASFNHPHAVRKPGSIGTPIEGVEMRLANPDGSDAPAGEIGEIAIKGHLIMKGYWNRPEATAEAIRDGWFFSGDLANKDEDGYYFIVDRAKDMIIRGGYNVYPREIEEVLYEHPEVAEAAVIGIPHEHYGEEIAAYVVPTPDSELTVEGLQEWIKERVAAYKYPRQIEFIGELPKGATGKILKRELRVLAEAPADAAANA